VPRLFHTPRTRSTRVLWLLEEIGAPYDLTILTRDDRRGPEHRPQRHPLGRVPVLELDDGTFIVESIAICLYLADGHPQAQLIGPQGSTPRALAMQWSVFALAEIEGALLNLRTLLEASADTAPGLERFGEAVTVIENALGDDDWLIDNRFSVADVLCASVLSLAHSRGMLADRPVAAGYVDRGHARPAYERAMVVGAAAAAP
jgi:glutathione S-transferase